MMKIHRRGRQVFVFWGVISTALLSLESARPVWGAVTAEAVEVLRKTVEAKPDSRAAKRNLSAALTELSRKLLEEKSIEPAIKLLEEALLQDAENGPAWMQLGDLLYIERSDFRGAVDAWKKALPLAPADIRGVLIDRVSRAELDLRLEKTYQTMDSARFQIRVPPGFNPEEAKRILEYLDARYAQLARELGVLPSKLTLIIYPAGAFQRITGGHEGVLGLYDGRIRIGERELGGKLEKVILSHELAHAFLHHAFGNNLPIWIQEGYAQSEEPERPLSESELKIESSLKEGIGWVPLKWLDRRFLQPSSGEDVTRAYLQSKQVVAALIAHDESAGFREFLQRVAKGEDLKSAFEKSFRDLNWNSVEHGRLTP